MTHRFSKTLEHLCAHNRTQCVPYLTAGVRDDLDLSSCAAQAPAAVVSLAFSDPCADTVTAAVCAQQALSNGATTDTFFKTLSHIRQASPNTALCVRAYANNIFAFGLANFFAAARDAGADAIAIPDLPAVMRELDPTWKTAAESVGLELIELDAHHVRPLIQEHTL